MDGLITLHVKLASPCHPASYLAHRAGRARLNELYCEKCQRRWIIGVVVPLDELVLYTGDDSDLPPAPPLPGAGDAQLGAPGGTSGE